MKGPRRLETESESMWKMPPAGILQTEMDEDALIELEIQRELEAVNLDAADPDFQDLQGIDGNNNDALEDIENEGPTDENAEDLEAVPKELEDYISRIQRQRLDFEQQLQECDDLLAGKPDHEEAENKLMVYEDWKELAEAAAKEGLSVNDYKEKLLKQIENDPYELEQLDVEDDDYEENWRFATRRLSLTEALREVAEANRATSPCTETDVAEIIEAGRQEGDGREEETVRPEEEEREDREIHGKESPQSPDGKGPVVEEEGRLALVHREEGECTNVSSQHAVKVHEGEEPDSKALVVHTVNPLVEFELFLREQMAQAEERYRQREAQLKEELVAKRAVEERLMLAKEEERLQTMHNLQQEEQELACKKEENMKRLEEELENQQKQLKAELKVHEETIAKLTEKLEEDRQYYEKTRRANEERLVQQNTKAATTIQKCYRGYRVRKSCQKEQAALAERRELRKQEKLQQRVEEVQRKIDERKEAERRQEEEERQKQEEEERRQREAEEKRLEAERKRKEEEERKRKEEEDRKQKEAEEKRRQEEERRRKKEEEKRLKEEEERRRREEEEERKRVEAEKKRKEEEEKKRKAEEERRKQEEERRAEEERKRKEEEEKKVEEERKRREEEEERKRKEEAERQKEEERKSAEEEKNRQEEEWKKHGVQNPQSLDKGTEQTQEEDMREGEDKTTKEQEAQQIPFGPTSPFTQLSGGGSGSKRAEEKQTNQGYHRSAKDEVSTSVALTTREQEQDSKTTHPASLSKNLEEKRLRWMKKCLPWSKVSNEPWKRKAGVGGKASRRPASAKKLSPIPDDVILAAAQVSSLRQVTTVELHDLPGCSLSTLSQCVLLKHLTLTQCRLVSLDHLSACKHLQCIDAQENLIEYVDLKELGDLHYLNLSNNKLTTIHGLTGCNNLRWLDLSHNRLTKLEGLAPLRRLHTLIASNNQLVSTVGLEQCPTIQRLDLSCNYLTTVTGLDTLCLLLTLDVSSNNLTQVPVLENSVLLQELILRENSIGPVVDLSYLWLPLLTKLDLSQNIIEKVTGEDISLLLLKRLDLAVNQIDDLPSFLPCLSECPRLEDLSLLGNPILGEDGLWENLKKTLPQLQCLNNEMVRTLSEVLSSSVQSSIFEATCLAQVKCHQSMMREFEKERAAAASDALPVETGSHVCDAILKFCDTSFKAAVEHRYVHEYGELSHTPVDTSQSFSKTPRPPSASSQKNTASDKLLVQSSSYSVRGEAGFEQSPGQKNLGCSEVRVSSQDKFSPSGASVRSAQNTPVGSVDSFSGAEWVGGTSLKKNLSAQHSGTELMDTSSPRKGLSQKSELNDKPSTFSPRKSFVKQRLSDTDNEDLAPVLSQKEKFEMALKASQPSAGVSATASSSHQDVQPSPVSNRGVRGAVTEGREEGNGFDGANGSEFGYGAGNLQRRQNLKSGADGIEKPQLSEKEKFEQMLAQAGSSHSPPGNVREKNSHQGLDTRPQKRQQNTNSTALITTDVVGTLLTSEGLHDDHSDILLEKDILDKSLEDLEEMMEGLQFDIDGFLDLDQFDIDEDFLEKGWRPEDSPQLPKSHPPLDRIPTKASSKPPLPPVPSLSLGTHHSPAPPPRAPAQAWRKMESPLSDIQTRAQPRPPSSVTSGEDSQAMTTGRSKREQRIAEDWGFKDSRTAEMMMQRAKKMKYNAERRKKLSKLDPQQRLKLFRKIEEVTKIHSVRPPPARVLPRKEYFQAREEEAQKKELERQMEIRMKAGRTYEWIHTQVGDYDVSSSCINQRHAAEYSFRKTPPDSQVPQQQYLFHRHSPMSEELESASHANSQRPYFQHRNSLPGADLSLTGQATLLPPIKTGSAPSSREREKISWRTEEVEKSVGWGGGKKRTHRK